MKSFLLLLLTFSLLACTSEGLAPPPIPQEPPASPLKMLAIGDSYTIGESVAESGRWPVQLGAQLEENDREVEEVQIIAKTGWTTANLIDGIENRAPASDQDLVGLLIGVNNEFQGRPIQEFTSQFEELLNTAIELAGGDKEKVFVVSIPDYGFTPFGESNQAQISSRIDQFNSRSRIITEEYQIRYINITDISREGLEQPELVATDGLHPSALQYERWVNERIFPAVSEMLEVK